MYLKVESGNGFEYCQLPKKNFSFRSSIKKLETNNIPIIVDKRLDCTPNWTCSIMDGNTQCTPEEACFEFIYEFGKGYKHIQYIEDGVPINILFNGNAYLIKENGKTIERF